MIPETSDVLPRRRSFGRPVVYILISLLIATSLFIWMRSRPTPAQLVKAQFMQDLTELDSTVSYLQRALVQHRSNSGIQAAFQQARLAYKRVEFISAYYSPETTRALNGPNIPEVDDDLRVNAPEGFQVLEEKLFPLFSVNDQAEALQTAAVIRSNVNRLRKISESNELTDSHVFDAMRLEVFRVVTLGITGFDSPVAFYSMPEAASALESLQHQLKHYNLADRDNALSNRLDQVFGQAITGLRSSRRFDDFDRLTFIGQQANVLSGLLMDAQRTLNIPVFAENRLLSPQARTLTDSGVFNPDYFTNFNEQRSTPDRVLLGKRLFFDPILSTHSGGSTARTCATCHQPDKAFTDGEPKSLAIGVGGKRVERNAPTLLNASLQAVQFYDSRVVFLEDQVSDVIQNSQEMHGSLPEAVKALAKNPDYRALFTRSYKEGITEQTLTNAVASYVRSLTSLDSRVDRYLRTSNPDEASALLTADEKRGFNLFMGKGKCATCHFFPLFNGTVPPAYQESESEVLGTPATAAGKTVDPDVGKFVLTGREPHRYAFKTPTVRHVTKTAPYMHNGVYRTLDQVVEFYDRGGGNGLGFGLDNQTLPFDKLNLTALEKKALVAFMEAL
ncbi:cytochrome c peroxidase [Spirosoma utsteinense]|uniref:Cytochrome c peroxidase n=1 Tax=Spirosoma utsteinense TaxID=2585773 RepID=A0ABR6W402_9BACT|nr:cytochrome c peroxidase [Spirosoma utsteinense]MBC3785158.1 cytochrome c peroxidase [Spirosoma utsteinense]MBC3790617.1 cytochrome c peroxidase [Spirosoma utsteinense]